MTCSPNCYCNDESKGEYGFVLEKVPKYYALKNYVLEMIDREEYAIDQAIPSERTLIDHFGISRITVRKAIDELVNEGYLYRLQGKGTYVKGDKVKQDLFMITSCTQDIINHGMTPSRKVIQSRVDGCRADTARILQIGSEERVFILERVYYANFEPLNCTLTILPYRYFPEIEKSDFGKESLYDVLEKKYGVRITKATRSLEARLALEDVAQKLDLHAGAPLLLFEAVTYGVVDGKEVPIEFFESHYRTDRFKFYINQIK
jgi:GntR family transcriptional regulator